MFKNTRYLFLYLIDVVFGIIEVLLLLRFILKFVGANPNADFVSWIFANTEGLLHPFEGAFPTSIFKGGIVIEFSTLLALIVYGLIAYILSSFLGGNTAKVE